MSDERSGARQTAAPALTLTRRQQKRARGKQGKRHTAAPRQVSEARQPNGTRARLAGAPEARVSADVAPAAAHAVAPVAERFPLEEPEQRGTQAKPRRTRQTRTADTSETAQSEEPRRARSKTAARPARPARPAPQTLTQTRQDARQSAQRQPLPARQKAAPAPGERGEQPAERMATMPVRVSKRTHPIPAVRQTEAVDPKASSGRRYPTLAQIASVTPRREEPDAQAHVQREAQPTPLERLRSAPERRRWLTSELRLRLDALPRAADRVRDRETMNTEPVPAINPARPHPTPRASTLDRSGEGRRGRRAPRAVPSAAQPHSELVTPVAVVHATIAAVAALAGATLLIQDAAGALWPLGLAAVAGAGGWLAYALAQQRNGYRFAAVVLFASELLALAWLLALLGPRAALLASVPALALLALRMSGRGAALAVALVAGALYVVDTLLALAGTLAPAAALSATGQALVDAAALVVGLGATLYGLLNLADGRTRAELVAQAQTHDARVLRARLARLTLEVEDDGERLDAALARALHGSGIPPVEANGALRPLAETVGAAAERLKTLQRDREDRLRLEGAVRAVTRAVERAWLGLPWAWPGWSGTAMDELVALLRTPRPHDVRDARMAGETREAREAREARGFTDAWSEETPTLLQLPALRWEPASRPLPSEPLPAFLPAFPYGAKAANGWSQPLSSPRGAPRTPVRSNSQITPLPWNEWNEWADWEG